MNTFPDYDDLLNTKETLSRVHRYEVNRRQGRILIDIYEVLAGSDSKYVAMPYLTFVGRSKEEYYGYGETEDDALRDCLSKIKSRTYHEITGASDIDELE
jgi:hypothetical protein